MRTSRQTILGHLQDPEFSESDPTVTKKRQKQAKNSPFATQSTQRAYFGLECVEQGWKTRQTIPSNSKYVLWADLCGKKVIFSYFCPLWAPVGQFLEHSGSCKWPKLVCINILICLPTLIHTLQPKIGSLGRFVWQKRQFIAYFCPFFAPLRTHLGHSRS